MPTTTDNNAGRDKTGDPVELQCPAHLKGEHRKVWKNIAPVLAEAGLTSVLDALAVEEMVKLKVIIMDLEKHVAQYGHSDLETGKRTAESAALAQFQGQFMSYLVKFGMVPDARGKVRIPRAEEERRSEARRKHKGAASSGHTPSTEWLKFAKVSGGAG